MRKLFMQIGCVFQIDCIGLPRARNQPVKFIVQIRGHRRLAVDDMELAARIDADVFQPFFFKAVIKKDISRISA